LQALKIQIERVNEYILKPLSPEGKTGFAVPDDLKTRVEDLARYL